jgi:glutathione peroxidase
MLRSALLALCAVGLLLGASACTPKAAKEDGQTASASSVPAALPAAVTASAPNVNAAPTKAGGNVHGFTLETIDGTERSLGDFRGKVLLLVNTASECGYTPQYAGLQKLHATYEKRGFSVVAFPSNDFGGQEPGSNKEIKSFCSTKFGVTFPLFAKITVKGPNKHPLYAMLTQTPPAGDVKWNFAKFLVGKDGTVVARYDSDVTPEAPVLVQAIEKAL